MDVKVWDEGVSWSCLPQGVISMVLTGAASMNSFWALAALALLSAILFFSARSGVQWTASERKFRSTTGWVFGGMWRGWGRWHVLPEMANLTLAHTKETLMNRRGAYDVGIESWELVWDRTDGTNQVLHDFTDQSLARSVLREIKGFTSSD